MLSFEFSILGLIYLESPFNRLDKSHKLFWFLFPRHVRNEFWILLTANPLIFKVKDGLIQNG
ncbi:MAG: hypothetical protein CME61_05785 [Halobacteriovoraceae bacterium]|nr:hypothetical protein [Halobacteriovoraceae bacterium]